MKSLKTVKISLPIFRIIINNTVWIAHGAFIIQCFQKEFNIAVSHYKLKKKDRCGDELIVQDIWQQIWGKITIILFFSINREALSSPALGLFASQYPQ